MSSFHTPITKAIKSGDTEKVRELLTTWKWSETFLHEACSYGQLGIVRMLIAKGAAVNKEDSDGCTPVLVAAKENHFDVVLALVSEFYCHVNTEDNNGTTLLHEACRHGQVGIVRMLIGVGADVDKKDHYGYTPAIVAAKESHCDVLLALVSEFGCDVNTSLSGNNTLLHKACKNGQLGMVRKLVGLGAAVDKKKF